MVMCVQPVGMCNVSAPAKMVSFKANEAKDEMLMNEAPMQAPKKERHWFKALASLMCPGLGQIFDGRFGAGIKQMLGLACLGLAGRVLAVYGIAAKNKYGRMASMVASVAAGFGALGLYIHSVKDAFRGGKKAA